MLKHVYYGQCYHMIMVITFILCLLTSFKNYSALHSFDYECRLTMSVISEAHRVH